MHGGDHSRIKCRLPVKRRNTTFQGRVTAPTYSTDDNSASGRSKLPRCSEKANEPTPQEGRGLVLRVGLRMTRINRKPLRACPVGSLAFSLPGRRSEKASEPTPQGGRGLLFHFDILVVCQDADYLCL